MELKQYQQKVIDDLKRFLNHIAQQMNIPEAYRGYWEEQGVPVGFKGLQPYQDMLPGVPNVCVKVPTGGGKTFIAACSIKPVFDSLPHTKTKAVVWLVPSDAILSQTLATLNNPAHGYRGRIDIDFSHRVQVYDKAQLLTGQGFSPTHVTEQLSVFVLSYDSFRTSKKEGRKAYQENSSLAGFAGLADEATRLRDADDTALINAIRALNPVVIVDESHHAASPLSKEMLLNFNPSFVLDLTATPKKESNIISYVDAIQLKREDMVKLPVIVYNRFTQTDVLHDAITLRNKLETQAKKDRAQTGRYIRPIVLLQAEAKGRDTTTFDQVKEKLIEATIPKHHIAIKTAEINELKGIDLLDEACPIRYIITINALKEGWDCPFAYILATIANRSSPVDVEQILGRVLRLPHTMKNPSSVLNASYVITSSADFQGTLSRVVDSLNKAGFSEKDYRVGSSGVEDAPKPAGQAEQLPIERQPDKEPEYEIEIDAEALRQRLAQEADEGQADAASDILDFAAKQADQYEAAVNEAAGAQHPGLPQEVQQAMTSYRMKAEFEADALAQQLPQFVVPNYLPLFGENGKKLLAGDALTQEFTLRDKDTMIDFSVIDAQMARVDIDDGGAVPRAWRLSSNDRQYLNKYFVSNASVKPLYFHTNMIMDKLSSINAVDDKELREYVNRVIKGLSYEQLEDLQQSPHHYLTKIKKKIETLLEQHCEKVFDTWIEQGTITCAPWYSLPGSISPLKVTSVYPNTLYTAEEEMNGPEKQIAWELSNLPSILWWHRNLSRQGFFINGYGNKAYPDFIAMTRSGKTLMIESKGDYLSNPDSARKVKLGRAWEKLAGPQYRYYMVFQDQALAADGAYPLNRFIEIARGL